MTSRTFLIVGSLALAGCATSTPRALMEARAEYQQASRTEAPVLAPVELHEAAKALAVAEQQFADHPRSFEVVDLAYIATRKAQLAQVQARAQLAQHEKSRMDEALRLESSNQRAVALRKELERTRELAKTQSELAAQRQRADDQERMVQTLKGLSTKPVRQEARGFVVTLPSNLLFASGSANLLPSARQRLDSLAEAVKRLHDQPLVVEGHTDAVGPAQYNEELSYRRAESVRHYLESRGVAPEQIRALGYGKSRPLADNATPEGRATNRRVEIVFPQANRPDTTATGGSGNTAQ